MYFRSKYGCEKFFGKILKINTYFGPKLSFVKKGRNGGFNEFDKICFENRAIDTSTVNKLLRIIQGFRNILS